MAWHRASWAGASLRLAGAALLCAAWAASTRLWGDTGHAPRTTDYALALVAFATASAGSVLLLLGAHLFDQVELPQRWTRTPSPHHGRTGARPAPRIAPPECVTEMAERVPEFGTFG